MAVVQPFRIANIVCPVCHQDSSTQMEVSAARRPRGSALHAFSHETKMKCTVTTIWLVRGRHWILERWHGWMQGPSEHFHWHGTNGCGDHESDTYLSSYLRTYSNKKMKSTSMSSLTHVITNQILSPLRCCALAFRQRPLGICSVVSQLYFIPHHTK